MLLGCILSLVSAFFFFFITSLEDLLIRGITGGFLAGLIIPHENGYAIALVEKIEDLVTILLLPVVRDYLSPPSFHLLTVTLISSTSFSQV